jgi:hypothetical protein
MRKIAFFAAFFVVLTLVGVNFGHAKEREEPNRLGMTGKDHFTFLTLAALFVDQDQFEQDLDLTDDHPVRFPLGTQIGFGLDFSFEKHMFTLYSSFGFFDAYLPEGSSSANLLVFSVMIHPGYGYQVNSWFSIRADVGMGLASKYYTIIGGTKDDEEFNASMRERTADVRPTLEVRFLAADFFYVGVVGGYHFPLIHLDKRFSGDWYEHGRKNLDLSTPYAGVRIGFRIR